MKKLLLTLLVIVGLNAEQLSEKAYGLITVEDFKVAYMPKEKKCGSLSARDKINFYKLYKSGEFIINGGIVKWDNGSAYFPLVMEDINDQTLYYYHIFNKMDICLEHIKITNTPVK